MEDSRTAPSLSPAEAEGFFATGCDARSAAPGIEPGIAPQPLGSPGGSGGTGAADAEPAEGAVVGGPETQANGFSGASGLRCSECGNFRHAAPRHKAHCRYAGQNCPGCVDAGAAHLASCPIATQLKVPTDTCCDGVDMPSVGPVHSPTCGNERPVVRASYSLGGGAARQAPAVDEFPGLFGKLLFASRDLAMHWVLQPTGRLVKGFCLECGGTTGADVEDHAATCRVGRVLDLVTKICAAAPSLAANGGAR